MPVIAIYSVKGGVGKTTLAANLAWCSAMVSCRETVLWDLDAAGGAGFLVGLDADTRRRAESVISLDREPAKLVQETAWPRLHLLPADESIRAIDAQLALLGKKRRMAKLTGALAARYQRVVLDCPPVLNELSAQVMRAADIVIVPLPPSPLSTRAFDLVVEEVRAHSKGGHSPAILPVLSMLDLRRKLHREALEEHEDWPAVPFASAAEQCAVRRQPVGAFAPASPVARSFRALWAAIEKKLAQRS